LALYHEIISEEYIIVYTLHTGNNKNDDDDDNDNDNDNNNMYVCTNLYKLTLLSYLASTTVCVGVCTFSIMFPKVTSTLLLQ